MTRPDSKSPSILRPDEGGSDASPTESWSWWENRKVKEKRQDGLSRRHFVGTVRNCLRLASDAVRTVVDGRTLADLRLGQAAVDGFAAYWGEPAYDFDSSPGRIEFSRLQDMAGQVLTPDEVRAYHAGMAVLSAEIEQCLYALRIGSCSSPPLIWSVWCCA